MGQIPTKYSHQYGLDPLGYQNMVVPHDCKRRNAGGFQCDGTCLESSFFGDDSPRNAGAHNPYTQSRRQQHLGKRKASSPASRKGHSRNTSNASTISTASSKKSRKSNPHFTSPPPTSELVQSAISVPRSVTIPVEEQALCFFLANWVLLPRQGRTGGYMEYIVPLYSNCKPNSDLHYALSAASLAAFGNRPSCRQFSSTSVSAKAALVYAKALEHTNRALMDPSIAKDDQTLAAVLMLGFFETLTTRRKHVAWRSHNEGAAALVKLRGPDNFKTPAGQILFAAVRTQTLIRCITLSSPYDKSVDWEAPQTFRDSGAHGTAQLNMILIDLRTDCERILTVQSRVNDPFHRNKVIELLARAQAAKHAYIKWANARMQSELWNFGPVAFIDSLPEGTNLMDSEVFLGRVDVYHEMWIAAIWNMGRTTGLLFSAIISRCAAWLSPELDFRSLPEYIEACQFDRKILQDMIASVPFLLGWHKRQSRKDFLVHPNDQTRMPPYSLSGFACGDDGPAHNPEEGKALGGYFSMWPMFVAGSSDFCTELESRWVHGRLRFISDYMGIPQADYFIKRLQTNGRLPSASIRRDKMALANISHPPSNFHGNATVIESQSATAQAGGSTIRLGAESNVWTSPATCSTASSENMYGREAGTFVATQ